MIYDNFFLSSLIFHQTKVWWHLWSFCSWILDVNFEGNVSYVRNLFVAIRKGILRILNAQFCQQTACVDKAVTHAINTMARLSVLGARAFKSVTVAYLLLKYLILLLYRIKINILKRITSDACVIPSISTLVTILFGNEREMRERACFYAMRSNVH